MEVEVGGEVVQDDVDAVKHTTHGVPFEDRRIGFSKRIWFKCTTQDMCNLATITHVAKGVGRQGVLLEEDASSSPAWGAIWAEQYLDEIRLGKRYREKPPTDEEVELCCNVSYG